MKLILQAIKALFRKLEAAVEALKPWCVQSDWEQNDPEAPDYMKGRTHYTAIVQKTLEIEMTEDSSEGGYKYLDPADAAFLWENRKNAVADDHGDTHVYDRTDTDDGVTGFEMASQSNPYGSRFWVRIDVETGLVRTFYGDTGGPAGTLTVTGEGEEVHKLDAKYIPSHTHDAASELSGVVSVANGGTGKAAVVEAMAAMGQGYCTCSTAAATVAKTASLSGFVLTQGALVGVKFRSVNTASSPTLNIAASGAKSIYNFSTNAAVVSGDMGACLHLFMYNGSQWVLLNPLT